MVGNVSVKMANFVASVAIKERGIYEKSNHDSKTLRARVGG